MHGRLAAKWCVSPRFNISAEFGFAVTRERSHLASHLECRPAKMFAIITKTAETIMHPRKRTGLSSSGSAIKPIHSGAAQIGITKAKATQPFQLQGRYLKPTFVNQTSLSLAINALALPKTAVFATFHCTVSSALYFWRSYKRLQTSLLLHSFWSRTGLQTAPNPWRYLRSEPNAQLYLRIDYHLRRES